MLFVGSAIFAALISDTMFGYNKNETPQDSETPGELTSTQYIEKQMKGKKFDGLQELQSALTCPLTN